jgi:hypothetical protein
VAPTEPVTLTIKVQVQVNTGLIPLTGLVYTPLTGTDQAGQCNLEYDSNAEELINVGQPGTLPVDVTVRLAVDPASGNLLSFEFDGINADAIIQAMSGDLTTCSSVLDFALDLNSVSQVFSGRIRDAIEPAIRKAVDGFRCRTCATNADCPSSTICDPAAAQCVRPCITYAECQTGEACDTATGRCTKNGSVACVPSPLGFEGRIDTGAELVSYGAPANGILDLSVAAGGVKKDGTSATSVENGGIVLGVLGGSMAGEYDANGVAQLPAKSTCVPVKTFANRADPDAVSFDGEAAKMTGASDYHLGLSVSDKFMDKTLFDVFQSGALCLNVDSSASTFLSSSLFRTFLPSLGVLTQGRDVPMLIALRPKEPPTVRFGANTVNGSQPVDPLVTFAAKSLSMDFYALIDERYSRLFSLTTDLKIPLSLEFKNNTVRPVLANLQSTVSNITAQNSEMLSEDPKIVADLLDAIIGLVQPIIGSVLQPVALPTFSGLNISEVYAKGVQPYPQTADGYQQLLFLTKFGNASPLVRTVDTAAKLVKADVPTATELSEGRRPVVKVDLSATGGRGDYEYRYRVDRGLWSPWSREASPVLQAPVLMLQGRHTVEFIARNAGSLVSEDTTPAAVEVMVDYDAPVVKLSLDHATKTVGTDAHDAVSRDDELSFRYRVAGGDWASFVGPQAFALSRLGPDASLEVEVTDAAGRVGTAYFGTPADALADPGVKAAAVDAGGCASAPVSLLALAGLALVRRRRARR